MMVFKEILSKDFKTGTEKQRYTEKLHGLKTELHVTCVTVKQRSPAWRKPSRW